jgi:hypothetical protein
VDMYQTHLGIRIQRGTFHIYLKKWFFWTPKDCCPPLVGAEKTFFSTLNVMISQMVRKKSVRFGMHIDIGVSYKIFRLEVPKFGSNFALSGLFSKGVVWRQFCQKTPSGL